MHGTVPTFHQHFRKIAFPHCGSNIFASNGNDEDVFATSAQHLFGNCGGESIPRDQETQSAPAVSIIELLAENHELILSALPAPVLAFG
jgi:hypothetical protein